VSVFWASPGLWPYVRPLFERGMTGDILRFAGKMMDRVYSLLLRTKQQQFLVIFDSENITFPRVLYESSCWEGECIRVLLKIKNFKNSLKSQGFFCIKLSTPHAACSVLIQLFRDYEANFPELLCRAFMLNSEYTYIFATRN
jgi:hypothetical protein